MSRIADTPVALPAGVEVQLQPGTVSVKGSKGELDLKQPALVQVSQENNVLTVSTKEPNNKKAVVMAGTTRALIANMVRGVSIGFEKKLLLNGVGYRVQAQGNKLTLTLGFSHPVVYQLPEGVVAEILNQTEITLSGIDKQKVGQAAAEIRAFRPVEPYKGKGVRYADERVSLKEAKKK